MNRKQFLFTLAAIATTATMLACGAGSGDTKSTVAGGDSQSVAAAPEPSTAVGKIGQTITLSSELLGDKTVVDVTVANAKQYAKEPGEFGSKPEKGVFLVLDVTVVCKQGTYHANPFNFKFVAKDGTVFEGAFTIGFKPELHATDLAAGQKTTGKIVFDVSKAALTGGRVQIDGVGLDANKPAAYWTL
jgi:methionine-rich copper-binding protein CopC